MQWWAIVLIFATLAGIYQDIIAPVFSKDKNPNSELLNLIDFKKSEVDSSYSKLTATLKAAFADTGISHKSKEYIKDVLPKFDSIKASVDRLSTRNTVALKKREQINSYEARGQMHNIARELEIDTSAIIATQDRSEYKSKVKTDLNDLRDKLNKLNKIFKPLKDIRLEIERLKKESVSLDSLLKAEKVNGKHNM